MAVIGGLSGIGLVGYTYDDPEHEEAFEVECVECGSVFGWEVVYNCTWICPYCNAEYAQIYDEVCSEDFADCWDFWYLELIEKE